ncbi:hypothetical protein PoB_000957600 [Plakobranchus ocellatus]|uniref:Uncharacterized protein n=1 Tax=Plakobranchus ocellatus TaxID=259542 RepID=A0AAV3YIK6_9GAST|nr:hypothetical protein PoB_000957600 [Plakobranchus ocellatus]
MGCLADAEPAAVNTEGQIQCHKRPPSGQPVHVSKEKGFGMSSTSLTSIQPVMVEINLPKTAVKTERRRAIHEIQKVQQHRELPPGKHRKFLFCTLENDFFKTTKIESNLCELEAIVVNGRCTVSTRHGRDVHLGDAGKAHEVTRKIFVKVRYWNSLNDSEQ